MLAALLVVGAVALVGCKSNSTTNNGAMDKDKMVAAPPPAPLPSMAATPLPADSATTIKPATDAGSVGAAPAKTSHAGLRSSKTEKTAKGHDAVGGKYVVKKGDNLSKIAKLVYGDSHKYKQIAMANNITNPNKIRVGQVLVIP
jgi:nucleoid-associated protein YgaU